LLHTKATPTVAAIIPPIVGRAIRFGLPTFTILLGGGSGTGTLNDAKLVKSFESIFVITLYRPESGNRYFTEKIPLGAVTSVNLKDLCCPPALFITTILAERVFITIYASHYYIYK
jgi:hypothetical protein